MLVAEKLTCNSLENPLGIGCEPPRFSWMLCADGDSIEQTEFELQVSTCVDFSGEPLWILDIESDQSVQVLYQGGPLEADTFYYWRVRIHDSRGGASGWSETAFFSTGLFCAEDWAGAAFIAPGESGEAQRGHYLRTEFHAEKAVKSAILYASAKGAYEAFLNGVRVGDAILTPGWTDYDYRIQAQAYDVTPLIRDGENAIGAHLGAGWFRSDLAIWGGVTENKYEGRKAFIARLVLHFADGTVRSVVTDDHWKCIESPVLESTIYHGEVYDAQREIPGWSEAALDDSAWSAVGLTVEELSKLVPQEGPYIGRHETFAPISLIRTPKGEIVLDFGQNLVGWVKLSIQAQPGAHVAYTHAEVLDKDGNFYTDNLRTAKQHILYICKSGEPETYEPHFTFMGFRYIKIEKFPGEIDLSCFSAVAVYSRMRQTASFSCSDELVNKLYQNIVWGMKGNFVDVPTDCPQRDERLGWTGDAQIFARTACTLMDTNAFFAKWLRDVAADQTEDGSIPHVVPDVLNRRSSDRQDGACGWGDAAVIVPWTLYLCYSDRSVLARQYDSMKAWVEYIRANSPKSLWNRGTHFGDWLALDAKEGSYHGATPDDLSATAYFARSTELLAKAARVLNKHEDAAEYEALYERIVKAFNDEFLTPSGRLVSGTQTAYALSLFFHLVTPAHRPRVARDLIDMVEKAGHLTTGFLGTPALLAALSDNGGLEAAYRLLLRREYPSWLYPVTMGATTVWEHWDGIKPDGSMWSADMNSFNHYAYGAVAEWMFTRMIGIDIDPENPGYKRILIAPKPGGGLTYAKGGIETPYGPCSCGWTHENGILTVNIKIPHNTSALITLPGVSTGTYGHAYFIGEEGSASAELGSGEYIFSYPYALESA